MRLLLSTPPALGHIFPQVPLAAALHAAGHDVLFAGYGGGENLALYARTGFPVVDVGDGSTLAQMYERWAPGRRYGLGERPVEEFMAAPASANAELSRGTISPLRELVEAWRPDVMVYDPFQGAVPLVAAEAGIPIVEHQSGLLSGRGFTRMIAERLGGPDPDGPGRAVSLEITPPSLHVADPHSWQMRYVPFHGPGVVPLTFIRRSARSRVLVTLGTVVVRNTGLEAIGRLMDQAAEIDAEILLPLDRDLDASALGTLPGNVRLIPWMPLLEVLRHCDAIVHHGGAGTMMAALTQAVPQLVLPQGADQFLNAELATRAGFALRADSAEVEIAQVTTLLRDPRIRAAAQVVRAENEVQPSPARIVERVVALAGPRPR